MHTQTTRYTSYLLRIWRSEADEPLAWRAYLQDLRTGQSRGFSDLESLLAFVEQAGIASHPMHLARRDEEEGDRPV